MQSLDAGFKIDIELCLPRNLVVNCFADPIHYPDWQKKLISYELMPKIQAKDLDVMNLEYDFGGQNVKIVRTVLSDNLPEKNVVLFEVQGMRCLMENQFSIVTADSCNWASVIKISSTSEVFKDDFNVMVEVFSQYFTNLQSSFKQYVESI